MLLILLTMQLKEENQAKIAEKIAEDKKQAEAAQQLDDLFKGAK